MHTPKLFFASDFVVSIVVQMEVLELIQCTEAAPFKKRCSSIRVNLVFLNFPELKAELVDPMGNLRSSKETIIYWNNETIKQFVDPRDGKKQKFFHGETSYTFALNVGYIESGLWR